MPRRPHVLSAVLLLAASLPSCTSYTSYGRGATTDDRPVLHRTHWRQVWGLVGSSGELSPDEARRICPPDGDVLVERSGSIYNFSMLGLLFHRTEVQVYCRDDEYRMAQIDARRRAAEALAALDAEMAAWRAANEVTYVAPAPRPVHDPASSPPSPSAPPPGASAPAPRAPSGSTTVVHDRRVVSRAKSIARTQEQCDQQIPPIVKDEGFYTASQLTHWKREPCHKCVLSGKAFLVYNLEPLTSGCE